LRVVVGFLLNPFSVLKARYEVGISWFKYPPNCWLWKSNLYQYNNLPTAFISLVRQGPSELLRGFLASSLRDAPYAGLFVVFYEAIKRETSIPLLLNSQTPFLRPIHK
jgi:solute carrier family 25 protein 38